MQEARAPRTGWRKNKGKRMVWREEIAHATGFYAVVAVVISKERRNSQRLAIFANVMLLALEIGTVEIGL